jgi:hypothetical protein
MGLLSYASPPQAMSWLGGWTKRGQWLACVRSTPGGPSRILQPYWDHIDQKTSLDTKRRSAAPGSRSNRGRPWGPVVLVIDA